MESCDSSPNYMRATSSFDAKKENSPQGGSECDDIISVSSSTCGSGINNNGIKYRTNNKKILKNFGSVRSFRRRAKSRIVQSPVAMSDDSVVDSSQSTPHYLKATSCSEGKKLHSESSQSKSASPSHKSLQTLSRTSSFRNMRILIKKTSFKPRRMSYGQVSEDVSVDRATHSSTLKDTKFPEAVELHNGGMESEKNSALKVCRYHHCSLHGHCHGDHDPVPPLKRFLYKKRRSMKKQRSLLPKTESRTKHSNDKNKSLQKSQMVPVVEGMDQGQSDKNGVDSYAEIYAEPEAQLFGDGYDTVQELDLMEVAFGETSFPERSYEENLNILRKYSSLEQGYCLQCSCHKTEQATFAPGRTNVESFKLKLDSSSLDNGSNNEIRQNGNADGSDTSSSVRFKNSEERGSTGVEDIGILTSTNEACRKDCPETPVIFDEVTKKNSAFSSASYGRTGSNSEGEGEFTTESTSAGDSEVNKAKQVNDSEANNNEIRQNGIADGSHTSSFARFKNSEEHGSTDVEDSGTSTSANEASNKDWPETPVVFDEVTKKNSVFSSASYSRTSTGSNSEDEGDFTTESTSAGDSEVNKVKQVNDSEANSRVHVQFTKQRHVSMWHLIHQHMSSNPAKEPETGPHQVADGESLVDGTNAPLAKENSTSDRDLPDSQTGTGNTDSDNQEIEIRKLFAIKLVREAIEKILLPEVQDQTADDQSVTSESSQLQLAEKNQSEACTQENYAEPDANKGESSVSSIPKEEPRVTDDATRPEIKETEEKVVRKSEKKAPKHWSNLKKWILLQRFIRELEKVRKFNPRKPQLLPLTPDPEAEKVNLRPQTVDERRNAEEWMLDYALRQAVNQLAPTQKKKVALLVKAFETVVPPQEEPQVQLRIPRLKDNSIDIGSNKEEAPVDGKAVAASDDGVTILESEKREIGTELKKKMEKLLVLNYNSCESSASKEENPRESSGDHVDLQGIHEDSNVSLKSECFDSDLVPTNGNIKPEDRDVENSEPSSTTENLIPDGNGKLEATENTLGLSSRSVEAEREAGRVVQGLQEDAISENIDGKMTESGQSIQMERKNHIKMWHMIYQHVVSGIAEKVGSQLLDGSEDDEVEDDKTPVTTTDCDYSDDSSTKNHVSSGFTKSDALKLIKEAFDEILVPDIQDDSSDTQSVISESISDQDISERNLTDEDAKAQSQEGKKSELPKAKNWGKLKKLILLRRSIRALEKARELKPQPRTLLPQMSDPEPEKVDLRSQMMDERKKAEQWMLDYAVQHIVTKLTPSRKRRVSMLVEAFEAVVPLPEM